MYFEQSIKEFGDSLKPIIAGKETLDIAKTIDTEDEFYSSEEWKEVWSGFQGADRAEKVGRKFEFIKGFVVNVDPNKNYGQPFKLFKLYKTSDGIKMLKEQKVGSCLSTMPLRGVIVFNDKIVMTERYYQKTEESRKYLATTGWVVI